MLIPSTLGKELDVEENIALQYLSKATEVGKASLRAGGLPDKKKLSEIFKLAHCSVSAFNAETCGKTESSEGSMCNWCTSPSEANWGACLDPVVIGIIKSKVPKFECGEQGNEDAVSIFSELEEESFNLQDFKCSVEALTDPVKCSKTLDISGSPCEVCTLTKVKGPQMCVSSKQAERLHAVPEISCQTFQEEEEEEITESDEVNPIYACNIKGVDHVTCLDKTKVGTDCTWCDAQVGGFCFPASWQDKAGKFLECSTTMENDSAEEEKLPLSHIINEENFGGEFQSLLSSACLKNGLVGSDEDGCRKTVDDSGKHCVICKDFRFGLALCMPNVFEGKHNELFGCE
jgi:hypothetical protein